MESSRSINIEKFLEEGRKQLKIHEKDELIWLVSLIYTDEFYGKNNLHLFYDDEGYVEYFKKVSGFVYSNKEAKKLLQLIKNELIYDEDEEKSENEDLGLVKSLDFFFWAEHKGYQVPKKVVEGLKWLMQMDYNRRQAEAEEKRMFPELSRNDFELLRKEPLWAMDKAVLYVNGLNTEEAHGNIRRFINSKSHIEKLCLYVTQAYRSNRLKVIEDEFAMTFGIKPAEVSYSLIEGCSVEPEVFINFVKTLPLQFPILEEQQSEPEPNTTPKHNKYELSTKDTHTLFKLIAGMAQTGYSYDPTLTRNAATSEIEEDTGVSAKTAKKWIDKAIETTKNLNDKQDS